jgi:hypothetical protein
MKKTPAASTTVLLLLPVAAKILNLQKLTDYCSRQMRTFKNICHQFSNPNKNRLKNSEFHAT